jgi:hypothetical protein
MARKMKKFSAGGAQGRYDRRMADIDKDFKKDSAGKTGRALEVLEAKRAQRTADAKDDLAKRTGADRTATRAAEKLAESNLTKTRKYGAPQMVSKFEPVASEKITETLSLPKPGLATSTKKAPAKAPAKVAAKSPAKPDINNPSMSSTRAKLEGNRADFRKQQLNRRKINAAAEKEPVTKFDKAAFSDLKTGANSYGAARIGKTGETGGYKGRGNITVQPREARQTSSSNNAATGAARADKLATLKKAAEAPGATQFAKDRYKYAVSSGMYAKGGKIKKYAAGGVTKEMPSSKAMGKTMKKPAKAKAKPFAATKFGAAMVKKSADTKGRAMMKKAGGGKCYAKGGSVSSASKRADGIAVRGKTKTSMTKMKKGGKC